MTRGSAASGVGRVAGLAAIVLLQTYWFLQPVPLAAKGLAALLLLASLVQPSSGLLAFAGLAPVSSAIAGLCGGGAGLGGQLLEQMALSVGAGVLLRGGPTDGPTRIGAPAALMTVVAGASALAMIPAAAAPVARHGLADALLLHQLVWRQTAQSSPVWGPLFAALVIAECGLLGWAVERTLRRSPELVMRLVAMALIGHAGAALWSLQAVFGGALRTGDMLAALPRLLVRVRISLETDVHAAASSLILAGVAGFGLASGTWPRKVGVSLLLLLVAAGLWLTGSRVALVLGVAAAVAAAVWSAIFTGRRRVLIACLAIGAIAAGTWATFYPANRYLPASRSASSRLVLMNIGVQLFEQAPVFGIGVGKFYGESAVVGGPALESLVGYTHQNAHNNFVQVLAEQGVVGLAALLWWLGVVFVVGGRAQISNPDRLRRALLLAMAACVGTWLTGHPLLVPEFAFIFWLYCGILLATTTAAESTRSRWPLWALTAAVLISVPPRAYALRNAADLEHQGFGLSMWQHDDAQRYREAGPSFALFIPATGRPVEVPIRRAPGAPDPLLVDVSIHGRLIDRVSIGGEAWQTVLVLAPSGVRRFELVDFVAHPPVTAAPAPEVLLRVGKTIPR